MSKKFSTTTADYLEWSEGINLIHKLVKDNKPMLSLLIACGLFFGLRISDLLRLRWADLLKADTFEVEEQKTGKKRIIRVNSQLKQHIKDCYKIINPLSMNDFCFTSTKGSVYSIQRLNVILKELKYKYRLHITNFSTHSLRKSFGRKVFDNAGVSAEGALVKLSEIFNHSNTQITRRYLGLKQDELMEVYTSLSF